MEDENENIQLTDGNIEFVLTKGYRIGDTIGAGQTGKAYGAIAVETNASVVIKITWTGFATEEIATMLKLNVLNCPHMIKLIDYFDDHHYTYLVLEFCNATDLQRFLENSNTRMDESLIRIIFSSVFSALKVIHLQGFLHSDVSLRNIFLHQQENGQLIAKLGDFGSCLNYNEDAQATYECNKMYQPPETRKSLGDIKGPFSDLWEASVCLFMTATNLTDRNHPFREGVKASPDSVAELTRELPGLSEDLADLIRKTLVFQYHDRLTVDQILAHPFFSSVAMSEQVEIKIGAGILANLSDRESNAADQKPEEEEEDMPVFE